MIARQPILTRALVVAVIALGAAILGRYGVTIPPDIRVPLAEVVAVAAPIALALWARRHTTPLADPRDATGRPLIVADTATEQAFPDGGTAIARRSDTA